MNDEEVDLRDYLRIIGKRKWLIIILVAVAAVSSAAFSFFQPKMYEAVATVKINTAEDSTYRTQGAAVTLIGSDEFLKSALPGTSLKRLLSEAEIAATPTGEADRIQIVVAHKDSKQARELANNLADRFVRESAMSFSDQSELNQAFLEKIEKQVDYLERKIAEAEENVGELTAEVEGLKATDTLELLLYTERLNFWKDQLVSLEQKKMDLERTLLEQKIRVQKEKAKEAKVISRATVPAAPRSLGLKRNVTVATLLSLIAACGLALVLEFLEKERAKK